MSRILSLFLVIILLFINAASLASCTADVASGEGASANTPPKENTAPEKPPTESGGEGTISVPTYKDYGRGTVDFENISYERPDCEKIISDIKAVEKLIKSGEHSLDEEISAIRELEDDYEHFLTMHSYASVMNSIDSTEEELSEEFLYLNEKYPYFAKAIEDMMVAAARSAHASGFEDEYFGRGLRFKI